MTTIAPERPADEPSANGGSVDEATVGDDGRPTTLLPVIRSIPEDRYDNPTWKGLLWFARDVVLYALVLGGLFLTDNPLLLVPLWIVSGLVISGLFIVGHDAAHEALFKSRRLNSFIGHVAMFPSWHVYEGWVLGHNRIHHGHTVRQGMDFVWHPLTPEQYAAMPRWKKARHRLEWSFLGSGAYYLRDVWWNKMIVFDPPAKWAAKIRRDRLIVGAFVLVASLLLGWLGWASYGSVVGAAWMVVKLLVIPFLMFQWTIGWVVHLHHIDPSIRWYKRREWNKFKGQMEGTTVLYVPRVIDHLFFHHIFFHVAHHVDMRIPWYHLPAACRDISAAFPGVVEERKLRLRDFTANTRQCKLYDFDEGRWLTYREGAARVERDAATPAPDAAWSGTTSH